MMMALMAMALVICDGVCDDNLYTDGDGDGNDAADGVVNEDGVDGDGDSDGDCYCDVIDVIDNCDDAFHVVINDDCADGDWQ